MVELLASELRMARKLSRCRFCGCFPNAKIEKNKSHSDITIDNQLKQMKIENLEYQVANLQRQLEKHGEEYEWLRSKFDNTTLLLEQN